jgi:hypothetical protein
LRGKVLDRHIGYFWRAKVRDNISFYQLAQPKKISDVHLQYGLVERDIKVAIREEQRYVGVRTVDSYVHVSEFTTLKLPFI